MPYRAVVVDEAQDFHAEEWKLIRALVPAGANDLFLVGEISFGDVVEALAPAQRKLGREINPTVFAPVEFADKADDGNHFVTTVLAERKLFVIGGANELESVARKRRAAGARAVNKGNRRPARVGRSKSR